MRKPSIVTESIFSGKQAIIPLADVQHIEPWPHNSVPGIRIITKHTRWDRETDDWANSIWIADPEAGAFKQAWCRYRAELEADTLADISPDGCVLCGEPIGTRCQARECPHAGADQ